MSEALAGTAALVTGSSSGIGTATARRLAAEGAAVAMVARRRDRLEQLAGSIRQKGGSAHVLQADVTDQQQAITAVREAVDRFGRLDTVVNNAGVMLLAPTSSRGTAGSRSTKCSSAPATRPGSTSTGHGSPCPNDQPPAPDSTSGPALMPRRPGSAQPPKGDSPWTRGIRPETPALTAAGFWALPPGDGAAYRSKFSGKYAHRLLPVGHNVPQEAPRDFADAVAAADAL